MLGVGNSLTLLQSMVTANCRQRRVRFWLLLLLAVLSKENVLLYLKVGRNCSTSKAKLFLFFFKQLHWVYLESSPSLPHSMAEAAAQPGVSHSPSLRIFIPYSANHCKLIQQFKFRLTADFTISFREVKIIQHHQNKKSKCKEHQ